MERQQGPAEDFKARRGGKGKLRVWQWLDDPQITIRERLNASGGLGYRVTLPKGVTGGRVIFLQSRNFDEAKEIARSKGREFRESRSTALVLDDARKIQAASAVRTLKEHGIAQGLDEVAREYAAAMQQLKACGLSVASGSKTLADATVLANRTGKPLLEVVEFAVKRLCPEGGTKTLSELATEMIEMKRGWFKRGDLRPASFRDFENRAGKIADEIGSFPLPEVTKQILFEWLHGLSLSRRSKRNYRMILAEMLGFAAQKRYLADNPLEQFTRQDVKQIEGASTDNVEPPILSPADAEKLLRAAFNLAELDLGAAVVLGLFGGVRTEELKRLQWEAVRLDEPEPFVVIGPEIAKKRRIRNVPLPECAVAWLRKWDHGERKAIARSTHANDFQKRFRKLCAEAKIDWESNAMRHSFGSYHFSLYGNSVETARILGHKQDDSVLFAHYRALTTKAQAELYFAIMPPKEDGVVVKFPTAATGG